MKIIKLFAEEEEKGGLRKRLVSESSSVRSEEEIPVAIITEAVSKKARSNIHSNTD